MDFHDFEPPKLKISVLMVTFGRVWRVQSEKIKKLMPEMKSSRWVDVPNISWNSLTPKIRKATASWSQRYFRKIVDFHDFQWISMIFKDFRAKTSQNRKYRFLLVHLVGFEGFIVKIPLFDLDFPKTSPSSRDHNFTNFGSQRISRYTGLVYQSRALHFWH